MWLASYLELYIVSKISKISGEFKAWFSLCFMELVTLASYQRSRIVDFLAVEYLLLVCLIYIP